MENLNVPAIIVAALANFVIGGLWYSPALFGGAWMRANRFTDADLKQGSPLAIFGIAFVLCLLMAANLAGFLSSDETTLAFALAASVAAGLGWAAFGLAVVALFERRSLSYMLINGGYLTVSFAAMGLILGAWR